VILLENSNEWNLFQAKRRILKKKRKRKKGARIEKQKRSSMFQKKKKEDEIYKLLGEILSKERKKGDHIFL
jgi:hypothetical protein